MIFQIELAGIVVEVSVRCLSTKYYMSDYIVENRVPDISIQITKADMRDEWQMVINNGYEQFGRSKYDGTWTSCLERYALYHKLLARLPFFDVFLMHGVVLSDGLQAVMLTAPSGVGKTTRGILLTKHHPELRILNGDKPLLRIAHNQVTAYGSPWRGKESFGSNGNAVLKTIYIIERSNHTEMVKLSNDEAFFYLLSQTYLPYDSLVSTKTMNLLRMLVSIVDIYHLKTEPTFESINEVWKLSFNHDIKNE